MYLRKIGTIAMAGLVPAIHALVNSRKDVDTRDKPGHDGTLKSRIGYIKAIALNCDRL